MNTNKAAFLFLTPFILLLMVTNNVSANDNLFSVKSNHSVEQTADRFEAIVKEKGLTFFTRIDHAKNASNVDLELRPTQLILFGNPNVGTKLMQCAPTTAIDLPQKALFWEDDEGTVWMSYTKPMAMKAEHSVEGCDPIFEKITGLLANLAAAATQ